ncbi:ComEC/Rec2 family competence protein [Thalassospiraceae bacterium LMO-JJ14]|nr:ComEC/Rec2 family competence protein [Thalassospiraceae bacterium LMO-JJ14]
MGIKQAFAQIKNAWLAERPQWALWLPVFLGAGIAAYFALPSEPPLVLGTFAAAFGTLVTVNVKTDRFRVAAIALTAFALGFASAQWRTESVRAPVISKRTKPLGLSGTIERIELSGRGGRIIVSNPAFTRKIRMPIPEKIRLSFKGDRENSTDLLPGDRVSLRAVLRPPPPPTMPGAFDFQRRAWFMGIGAYGFVLGDIRKTGDAARAPPWGMLSVQREIETLRLTISTRVHELAPDENGAVAAALLTGHRSYIGADVLQVMRDAGIAHLLAISGLHIGLVAGIVFAGVRLLCAAIPFIALRLNTKKTAALMAIPAAFAYAVLAGFTVPTERAFLMTGLMLAGVLMDRRALSMRNVCWAAAVILLFRPESLTGPGFQMSFAAVTALIAIYSALGKHRRKAAANGAGGPVERAGRNLGRYLMGVTLTTVVASTATAPFAVYHFQHAAAFGLVANAVAVPLAALWVMPLGIVTLWAMPFGLETVPLQMMCTGIDLILSSARYLASLPGATVDLAAPPLWSLCIMVLSGLWMCLWTGRWRLYALPLLMIGFCGSVFSAQPDIIIDGQGRLIAVLHEQGAFLTSSGRKARFESEDWQQRSGHSETPHPWLRSAEHTQGRLRCDDNGCVFDVAHKPIAISMSEITLMDDCRRSWMLVATIPVRGKCRPPWGVIDRFDLWRYGTHSIKFTDRGPEIRTVNGERGRRPWVLSHAQDDGIRRNQ